MNHATDVRLMERFPLSPQDYDCATDSDQAFIYIAMILTIVKQFA